MPKIRRKNLPPTLLHHLLDRIRSRDISADQLGLFAEWLDTAPEVPAGRWFKRFPTMTVCGDGELVKTFLTADQLASGERNSVTFRLFLSPFVYRKPLTTQQGFVVVAAVSAAKTYSRCGGCGFD